MVARWSVASGGTLRIVDLPPIEQLDSKAHDRVEFESGEPSLDAWLKEFAGQTAKKDGARTYVACDGRTVVGYYSLCSFQVESTVVPKPLRLAGYPVPAVLLARLAVDKSRQGHGLGGYLLLDALRVSALVADQIGARIMVVHALHEAAADFYLNNGFDRFVSEPLTLSLPMHDIRATLEAVGLR